MKLVYYKYEVKYFINNCKYYLKMRWRKARKTNVLYFVFEPDQRHPGVADRIKAIVSLYNVAKANNYEFKFFFETPFKLQDYFIPRLDWVLNRKEMEYSFADTRIINECNWRYIKKLTANKQYHCYNYAGNDIPWQFPDTGNKWHILFHELFIPCEDLKHAYRELGLEGTHFITVQLRFVNALERFEKTFFDNYIEDEKERLRLITKCKKCIGDIQVENPKMPIYVFSDSKVFLDSLHDLPVHVLDNKNIGHTSDKINPNLLFKTFLDLYVMSKSVKIYRIKSKELYNDSCFALLASRIGNVTFIDRYLDT